MIKGLPKTAVARLTESSRKLTGNGRNIIISQFLKMLRKREKLIHPYFKQNLGPFLTDPGKFKNAALNVFRPHLKTITTLESVFEKYPFR